MSRVEPSGDATLDLRDDVVRVWQAPVRPADVGRGDLSDAERVRADRYVAAGARDRFVTGRSILRRILGRELRCAARLVDLRRGEHGKPYVDGADLRFNVAHSGDVVLLAFARGREVGVDVQQHRPGIDHLALARLYFSPSEARDLAALEGTLREEAFFACWARKEAVLKAWGEGVSAGLGSFDVTVLPSEPVHLVSVRHPVHRDERWWLTDLDAGDGYAAAVAVEGVPRAVDHRLWGGA